MFDGQGNCNLTRTNAALALANWLASDPTGTGATQQLIIGDLNSYAMEDPIIALTDANFDNLIERFVGNSQAYSFVFQGESGYLDHALANAELSAQITGVTEWHSNADEPRALDYNVEFKTPEQVELFYKPDPFRASDHDALLVKLLIPGDLNNDGVVDRQDRVALLLAQRFCQGQQRFLAEADYDRNGCINSLDFLIWREHLRDFLNLEPQAL